MATVNDRYVKLVVAYLDTYKALSDDAATGMLKEYLSIERARTDVKSEYVPRFGKVITAKKVARFFQVDNKLDAVINADMARLIRWPGDHDDTSPIHRDRARGDPASAGDGRRCGGRGVPEGRPGPGPVPAGPVTAPPA